VEGVGGRTSTLIESAQDMSTMAIRIKRGVNHLVKRAVPQILIKAPKHALHPFLVKGGMGRLLIQKQA